MEDFSGTEKHYGREEIFSKAIRAGKRTYFLDVKSTKSNDFYLTITESKRKITNQAGRYQYEKHKIFLYREDFEKFFDGMQEVLDFIDNESPAIAENEILENHSADVEFEDLETTVDVIG
ncbi:MAG: PUR family DNA/RNA-binding protein [Bacteroidales bacterium]|nr:PUR family DNA/RNA-binding protein [Bacteroidales bacterium]